MTHRWRGHEHPELYTMIHAGPGPGASDPQTSYWQALTNELMQVDADLNKALNDLKATWEGSASQSANAGMTPLQAWASDARTGSNTMRISTEDQAEYIATARAAMPKPVEVTTPAPAPWDVAAATGMAVLGNPGPAAMVAMQAGDHERQEAAQNAAAEKAVDTMTTYESSSTWNRNTLGTFVPPPEVVVSTPAPAGANMPGGQIGAWFTGSTYAADKQGSDDSTRRASTAGSPGPAPAPPPLPVGAEGAGSGNTGGGDGGGHYTPPPLPQGDGSNGETTPENFAPPAPPPPAPPTPPLPPAPPPGGNPVPFAGGLPLPLTTSLPDGGSAPGAKPGGTPSGPGGRPGAMPPSVGGPGGFDADGRPGSQLAKGGVVGMGVPGGEGMAGRGAAGTAAGGARGGALAGGPMGMGAGAQGEDDDEHFAPDYLLETTDVFGDERVVSPAVIGGETPGDEER